MGRQLLLQFHPGTHEFPQCKLTYYGTKVTRDDSVHFRNLYLECGKVQYLPSGFSGLQYTFPAFKCATAKMNIPVLAKGKG